MLEGGEIPLYVPNWWNPYAPNVGQKDPQARVKLYNTIKIVIVVLTMLGGAILALTINVLVRFSNDQTSVPTVSTKRACKPRPRKFQRSKILQFYFDYMSDRYGDENIPKTSMVSFTITEKAPISPIASPIARLFVITTKKIGKKYH